MMIQNNKIALLLALLTLAGCTDRLFETDSYSDDDSEGVGFSLSVSEQADLAYSFGDTRAAANTQALAEAAFGPRQFEGDAYGLQLHTLPLPLMGIHPRTVGQTDNNSTEPATRASATDIVTAGSDPINFHDSLTIWGYTNTGYRLYKQNLIKKIRGWRTSTHWPYGQGTSMRFYAIAPSMESLENVQVLNTPAYATAPAFRYVVPDASAQRDLLFGVSDVISIDDGPTGLGESESYPEADTQKEKHLGDDDKRIQLNFKHLLTTIRFAQGKIPSGVRIKEIRLQNIKNRGDYYPDEDDNIRMPWQTETDKGCWHRLADSDGSEDLVYNGNYSIKVSPAFESTQYQYTPSVNPNNPAEFIYQNAGENVYIDGGQALFLMPHYVTSHAKMVVVCDIGGRTDVHLTASLEGCIWKKGYTITYYLSIGKVAQGYYLLVDPAATTATNVHEHAEVTENGFFTIHSYRNFLDFSSTESGATVYNAVPWQVTGFSTTVDGTYTTDNKPSWLTSITGLNVAVTGSGTGQYQNVYYQIAPQDRAESRTHSGVLQTNLSVEGSFDLSTHTPNGTAAGVAKGTAESANCYIVNANGSYCFPAVYGNSLGKSDAVGEGYASFNPAGIFIDHKGNPIRHKYVETQVKDSVTETLAPETGYAKVTMTYTNIYNQIPRAETESKTLIYAGDMTAELLWEDDIVTASGGQKNTIIQSVNYNSPNLYYIGFTVGQVGIKPCNAVIALKGKKRIRRTKRYYTLADDTTPAKSEIHWSNDNGATWVTTTPVINNGTSEGDKATLSATPSEILWTWHIWVTDEVYKNTPPTEGGINADVLYPSSDSKGDKSVILRNTMGAEVAELMPANLGWVSASDVFGHVAERDIWVEIRQTVGNGSPIHLKIHQDAIQKLVGSASTIYQWGRPTALPMVANLDGTPRTIYGSDAAAISPTVFQSKSSGTMSDFVGRLYNNMMYSPITNWAWWNAQTGGQPALWAAAKTLYDPCPPGYQLPPANIFQDFSLTGDNLVDAIDGNKLNLWSSSSCEEGKGAYIYSAAHRGAVPENERYGQVTYIPASGYWNGGTQLSDMRTGYTDAANVYFWTYDHDAGNKKAVNVRLRPVRNTYTTDVFHYNQQTDYSNAMPIRPMKIR